MTLAIQHVSKTYASSSGPLPTLIDMDFKVDKGEFVSLIGPSGCGKSTLFNIISGLELPSSGAIYVNGQEITGKTGHVGYMMQKDALLPWRTVVENATIGIEIQGISKKDAQDKAYQLLPIFGLESFANEYPARLSGGMRQRVALLRTAMMEKEIWLLDEPFGSLDALTRSQMQTWLLNIWQQYRQAILFITHSIEEAIYLSDRVIVLSSRPARIIYDLDIQLPRPRAPIITTEPAFLHYKKQLQTALST
ncbi:ABC transporter ATP-binding protein [Mechercharimyces sp. CAU 1602]|uniref:ABC transporter ATP-binding protein n=1 Tax=Mechercharimyces sp. CAU 1602 TaxID=2973933 RepID=UPI002163E331|nr:ABC transporter ATP-binding protein [Mechercharimyces sp. CAU 1602]MCS1352338.1 ABC transporter ATP-binding protein [Mechercharimyces sp. CAU 1602]